MLALLAHRAHLTAMPVVEHLVQLLVVLATEDVVAALHHNAHRDLRDLAAVLQARVGRALVPVS